MAVTDTSWLAVPFTPQELWHLLRLRAWVDACRARDQHHDDSYETRRWRFWRACYQQGLISEWIVE